MQVKVILGPGRDEAVVFLTNFRGPRPSELPAARLAAVIRVPAPRVRKAATAQS